MNSILLSDLCPDNELIPAEKSTLPDSDNGHTGCADSVGAAKGIDLVQFLADDVGQDIITDTGDEADTHSTMRKAFLKFGFKGIHLELKSLPRLNRTTSGQRLKMKIDRDFSVVRVA